MQVGSKWKQANDVSVMVSLFGDWSGATKSGHILQIRGDKFHLRFQRASNRLSGVFATFSHKHTTTCWCRIRMPNDEQPTADSLHKTIKVDRKKKMITLMVRLCSFKTKKKGPAGFVLWANLGRPHGIRINAQSACNCCQRWQFFGCDRKPIDSTWAWPKRSCSQVSSSVTLSFVPFVIKSDWNQESAEYLTVYPRRGWTKMCTPYTDASLCSASVNRLDIVMSVFIANAAILSCMTLTPVDCNQVVTL